MRENKGTKQALLGSGLAILLCLAMLMGTTFAWFTDSLETSSTKIQSGKLDVSLSYKNSETTVYAPVSEETNIFKQDAKWEPGYAEYVNLEVANIGNLALKYSLGVNIIKETPGKRIEEDGTETEIKLSEFIKYALLDGEKTYTQDTNGRNQAIQDAENADAAHSGTLANLKVTASEILEKNEKKNITLIVYMPRGVGNAANARTGETPSITLGINLMATQATVESDSFGNTYDEDAKKLIPTKYVFSPEDLKTAIADAQKGDVIGIGAGEYDLGTVTQFENKDVVLIGLAGENEKVTLKTKIGLRNSTVELHNIHVESSAQAAMLAGTSVFRMSGGSLTNLSNNERGTNDAVIGTFTNSDATDVATNCKIELSGVTIVSKRIDSPSEGRLALHIDGNNTYCHLTNCDIFGYSVFSSGTVVIEGGKFTNIEQRSGAVDDVIKTNPAQINGKDYLNNAEAAGLIPPEVENESNSVGDAIRFYNNNGKLKSAVVSGATFDVSGHGGSSGYHFFGIRYLGGRADDGVVKLTNIPKEAVFGVEGFITE